MEPLLLQYSNRSSTVQFQPIPINVTITETKSKYIEIVPKVASSGIRRNYLDLITSDIKTRHNDQIGILFDAFPVCDNALYEISFQCQLFFDNRQSSRENSPTLYLLIENANQPLLLDQLHQHWYQFVLLPTDDGNSTDNASRHRLVFYLLYQFYIPSRNIDCEQVPINSINVSILFTPQSKIVPGEITWFMNLNDFYIQPKQYQLCSQQIKPSYNPLYPKQHSIVHCFFEKVYVISREETSDPVQFVRLQLLLQHLGIYLVTITKGGICAALEQAIRQQQKQPSMFIQEDAIPHRLFENILRNQSPSSDVIQLWLFGGDCGYVSRQTTHTDIIIIPAHCVAFGLVPQLFPVLLARLQDNNNRSTNLCKALQSLVSTSNNIRITTSTLSSQLESKAVWVSNPSLFYDQQLLRVCNSNLSNPTSRHFTVSELELFHKCATLSNPKAGNFVKALYSYHTWCYEQTLTDFKDRQRQFQHFYVAYSAPFSQAALDRLTIDVILVLNTADSTTTNHYCHQQQIGLTLCNLLSQDYRHWRVLVVAPDSMYHPSTARTILEIDKWNQIINEYFSSVRFSLLGESNNAENRHRLELLLFHGSDRLDAALQFALQNSTSQWILFWNNPNEWSTMSRLKTQVRPAIYFDQHIVQYNPTPADTTIPENLAVSLEQLLASTKPPDEIGPKNACDPNTMLHTAHLNSLYNRNWLSMLWKNHSVPTKTLLTLLKEIQSNG